MLTELKINNLKQHNPKCSIVDFHEPLKDGNKYLM